ncbi:MAG: hypothetical protein U0232_28460 [Thermomicrobiales bacterium]
MEITWRDVPLPDFGDIAERPAIPAATHAARCARAYAAANADWLVVYGDREHYANLTYLIGFDPRFEEAILLLGPADRRILLVGNEGLDYASLLTLPVEVALCQSLSLPGQDRRRAPRLADALRDAGLRPGQSVGLIGWKYLTPAEWAGALPGFFAPAMLVDTLRDLTGDPAAVREATPILLDPTTGLRATAKPSRSPPSSGPPPAPPPPSHASCAASAPASPNSPPSATWPTRATPSPPTSSSPPAPARSSACAAPAPAASRAATPSPARSASGAASAPAPASPPTTTGPSSTRSPSPITVASPPGTRPSASASPAATSTSASPPSSPRAASSRP